jgi:hypothetical protein
VSEGAETGKAENPEPKEAMTRTAAIVVFICSFLLGCGARSGLAAQARALGTDEFSPAAWSSGDQSARGRMVNSFLQQYRADTLSSNKVRELLGESTGYYDYDHYLAYYVGAASEKKEHLLVFVTDHNSGRVVRVMLVPVARPKSNSRQ